MTKRIKKKIRVAKKKKPSSEYPVQMIDYRERICDKCSGHVWTDQNKHYGCGGNLP